MTALRLAKRLDGIAPFHVMALLGRARELEAQGRDLVHMEIGEPDFPTPPPIVEAGRRALAEGRTQYTPALGLPALREAIAGYYADRYGVAVSADRIVVTPGASGALQLVTAALVNPGERVLMADPGYPCNRHFVRLVEGEAVAVPVSAATGYQLTSALLQEHWRDGTVAVLLASPANPTGTLVDAAQLQAMADQVARRGGRLIVDEIYHGLVYEQEAPTALAVSDQVFVINSFSKYFGMTGWRLGWAVAPMDYVPHLEKLAQNVFLAASTPAQYAALAAFRPETIQILEQRRRQFAERRDFLLPALRQLGFQVPITPQGAFYIYADCSAHTDDSFAFCHRAMEEAGVVFTPGRDFGEYRAERHVRFAYTQDIARLEAGVDRLRRFLGR